MAVALVGALVSTGCSQAPRRTAPAGEVSEPTDPQHGSPTTAPRSKRKIAARTVTYATRDGRGLQLDVFQVPGTAPLPVLVVMHGGIWRRAVKRLWARYVPRLVRAGYVVVMPDVRLAPPGGTSLFPTSVDDLSDVMVWLRRHAPELGGDPERIGMLGSSSGGHLALMAAGTGRGRPDAVAAYSPLVHISDLYQRNLVRSGIEAYLGCLPVECPDRYQAASPLFVMDRDTPPTLLVHASREAVPRVHFVRLEKRLERLGIHHLRLELDDEVHGLKLMPDAIGPSIEFMRENL